MHKWIELKKKKKKRPKKKKRRKKKGRVKNMIVQKQNQKLHWHKIKYT